MKQRKVNPLITAIKDQIDQYKREANLAYKKATRLATDRMLLRALYAPIFVNLTENDSIYIYTHDNNRVQFVVYMRELDSFKDARLTSTISSAMDLIGDKVKETDFAQYEHKEYRISTNNIYAVEQAELQINAYVKTDSPTCRKIQIGTEIKAVPKYKFECN
mgnify:FL=1|jgi:hypothetical protein